MVPTATNTLKFPSTSSATTTTNMSSSKALSRNDSSLSIVSMHATALDVCHTIYGEATLSTEVINRFYESSASESLDSITNEPNSITL